MKKIKKTIRVFQGRLFNVMHRNATLMMLILGTLLLVGGLSELSVAAEGQDALGFKDDWIRVAICQLLQLQEGAFGALIMVVSGISAIISAAFGAYRAATALIVVACGSFILRSVTSLFFGNYMWDNAKCESKAQELITANPPLGRMGSRGVPSIY